VRSGRVALKVLAALAAVPGLAEQVPAWDRAAHRLWAGRENEASLRRAIALYEEELARRPSVPVRTRLGRAYYLLADLFLQGRTDEQVALHNKGRVCMRKGLMRHEGFRRALEAGRSEASAVGLIGKEHTGPLFWRASHLGRWLEHQSRWTQWRHRGLLVAMLRTLDRLDPRYFYGGTFRLWAAYYLHLGKRDKAAASFGRAAEIAPFFLMTRRMYALEYARPQRDRKLFVRQLTLAVQEPEPDAADVLPEFRLEQRLAKSLLDRVDEFFPD
jgi:hypothetical protein